LGVGTNGPAKNSCVAHFHERNPLRPLGDRVEWPRTVSRNVCQAAEYFFQIEFRASVSSSIIPPLIMVRNYWKLASGNWERHITWVENVLGMMQNEGSLASTHLQT
jgi:hypothetical protein